MNLAQRESTWRYQIWLDIIYVAIFTGMTHADLLYYGCGVLSSEAPGPALPGAMRKRLPLLHIYLMTEPEEIGVEECRRQMTPAVELATT